MVQCIPFPIVGFSSAVTAHDSGSAIPLKERAGDPRQQGAQVAL